MDILMGFRLHTVTAGNCRGPDLTLKSDSTSFLAAFSVFIVDTKIITENIVRSTHPLKPYSFAPDDGPMYQTIENPIFMISRIRLINMMPRCYKYHKFVL